MSKFSDELVVPKEISQAVAACRNAIANFGWKVIEQTESKLVCEEVALMLITWPVTITLQFTRTADATKIILSGSSWGYGPIQSKHVKKQLENLKNKIAVSFDSLKMSAPEEIISHVIEPQKNKEQTKNSKQFTTDIISNFDRYAKCTKERDWKGVCELNNVTYDSFGTMKELKILPDYLQEEEVVFALASGMMKQTQTSNSFDFGLNTWLVVLTNERFLFLDCAMLTKSIDIQSIRHDHVQAVSSSQGLMLGKIIVDLGNRMIVIDNCIKDTVSIIVTIANNWHRELKKRDVAKTNNIDVGLASPVEQLEKLTNLFSLGALTEEEFKIAKGKILERI